MSTKIDVIVEQLFPKELIDFNEFTDWCTLIREEVQYSAADLIYRLNNYLDSNAAECTQKCSPRPICWELFGDEGDRLIKSVYSIRSKLARDMMNRNDSDSRFSIEELRKKILSFSDLGRVRLVGEYPSDIQCLRKKLFRNKLFINHYKCPKGAKDFVFDPKMRDGLKGHRALQFSVKVPIDSTIGFKFEIQLMTRLQHAWDRRNHLLYEWQREHPNWKEDNLIVELAVNDFACAEALHLVDQQADHNQSKLLKIIRKGQLR